MTQIEWDLFETCGYEILMVMDCLNLSFDIRHVKTSSMVLTVEKSRALVPVQGFLSQIPLHSYNFRSETSQMHGENRLTC